MTIRPLPSVEILRRLLEYDPATGRLTWLERTPKMFAAHGEKAVQLCNNWNAKNAGKVAMNHYHGPKKSHLAGKILGQVHLAHRIAWAIHYGVSEFGMIDHIDGDGRNNRIANLRLANPAINSQNAKRRDDNTSGAAGVHWHVNKRWGKPCWVARIQCGRRRMFLGSFETKEEAIAARLAAEKAYGFGPSHGKSK